MIYKVFESFRVRTSQGEDEIQPGGLLKLSPQKAKGLLERGKIKPFCYWIGDTVIDCLVPCFEIRALKVIHECHHFKTYFKKVFLLADLRKIEESQK